MRKYLLRRLVFPAIIAAVSAVIPFLNVIIPEAIIFVLFAHHREKQVVEDFFKVLEKVERVLKYT